LTGALTLSTVRAMTLTAFHSFWGQFGWMGIPYSDRTYDVLATLSLLVALGVALFLLSSFPFRWSEWARRRIGDAATRRAGDRATLPSPLVADSPTRPLGWGDTASRLGVGRWVVGLLLLEALLVIVGVVFYNLRYLQPQGRYLFPALPALAILSVAGVGELFRDKHVGLILTIAGFALYWLCIFSLFQVIGPAFAAASA